MNNCKLLAGHLVVEKYYLLPKYKMFWWAKIG
jgi:hypothetical protein